mgnify:CR=1 FL=1
MYNRYTEGNNQQHDLLGMDAPKSLRPCSSHRSFTRAVLTVKELGSYGNLFVVVLKLVDRSC